MVMAMILLSGPLTAQAQLCLHGIGSQMNVFGTNCAGAAVPGFALRGSTVGFVITANYLDQCGVNGNGDPHFSGKGALPNTIGNPLETTIFFSRLIYEGTLDKFPGLKICGAHGGGYLPSYLGRTDAQCRRQDDVCTGKKRPVEEYFHTQLMADIMVFREEGLRHLVAELGVGQLVYGTDIPFGWPVTPDFILNARFLNDAQKEAILGGNLIKLLKLSPSTTA